MAAAASVRSAVLSEVLGMGMSRAGRVTCKRYLFKFQLTVIKRFCSPLEPLAYFSLVDSLWKIIPQLKGASVTEDISKLGQVDHDKSNVGSIKEDISCKHMYDRGMVSWFHF